MKKFLDLITEQLQNAFEAAGYPTEKITATISNRPDLCEYQCNGAMALAKQVHQAPMEIAEAVVAKLAGNPDFVRLSEAYGIPARYAANNEEAEQYAAEMLAAKSPFVLVCRTDPDTPSI